jgi:hypothetical protein
VLLTLPYSFSQLGMASGIALQMFYGLLGSWTSYLISSLYLEYRSRIETKDENSVTPPVMSKDHVIQVKHELKPIHRKKDQYALVKERSIQIVITNGKAKYII